MNSRKGSVSNVLDPFEVENGWFTLELVGFQVLPAESLDPSKQRRVSLTIERLRLNDRDCRDYREEYAEDYWKHHIDLDYLSRRAPFVAMELRRQGRLRAGDS